MSDYEIMAYKLVSFRQFYDETTGVFVEVKRKIEAEEEPYVPRGDPESYSEPPFLTEWIEADEKLRLQRQLCLSVLQRTLVEFMNSVIARHPHFPKNKPDDRNWFKTYQRWFLDELRIDWMQSGADLKMLEELTHARNSVQHGGEKLHKKDGVYDSHSLVKRQGKNYVERFPDGVFVDQEEKARWKVLGMGPEANQIDFPPETLELTLQQIDVLCKFIDASLPRYYQ